MTVYVDDMRAQYGRLVMCHMIADSDEELRAMAQQIDVRQRWHQGDHFDICLSKRELAVRFGAIEITLRQCAAMNFRRKMLIPSLNATEHRYLRLVFNESSLMQYQTEICP